MRAEVLCRLCHGTVKVEQGQLYHPCPCGVILARSDGRVVIVISPSWSRPEEKPFEIQVSE